MIASKEFNFVHNDLHWHNIVVARTDDVIAYSFENKIFYTTNLLVKVIDFGLSRVEDKTEVSVREKKKTKNETKKKLKKTAHL